MAASEVQVQRFSVALDAAVAAADFPLLTRFSHFPIATLSACSTSGTNISPSGWVTDSGNYFKELNIGTLYT